MHAALSVPLQDYALLAHRGVVRCTLPARDAAPQGVVQLAHRQAVLQVARASAEDAPAAALVAHERRCLRGELPAPLYARSALHRFPCLARLCFIIWPPPPFAQMGDEVDETEMPVINIGVYDGPRNDIGEREGSGRSTYANKDVYVGDFKKGHRHGKGTYRWAYLGMQYKGDYVDGVRQGKGTMWYTNGIIY